MSDATLGEANLSYAFPDYTVIVTGAARGVGLGIATLFASAGARVYMVDHDGEEVARAADTCGGIGVAADVSSTEDVERVVATAVAETGRVDVLVNNAGILRDTVVWKMTDDDWERVLGVHLGGTFRFTRACIPHFRAQNFGRIINVTSYSGMHGNPGQANYAAAKGGVIGFTRTTAKELARFGVTVNALSPNAHTRMFDSVPPDRLEAARAAVPLGRLAHPDEMAPAVAYLASREASYVTGTILSVDGGISM